MKLALIYNEKRERTIELTGELAKYLYALNVDIMLCGDIPGFSLDNMKGVDFSQCDTAVVMGGDGTMLAAVREIAPYGVPLFGINMGRVGFLTSVEKEDAFSAIDKLLKGEYTIRERLIIKAGVMRDGKLYASHTAFNDFVVGTGAYSRAITFDLSIDGQPINSYNADGIIVSTPTGSTGYSLSAGGPILMDDMDITLITPVCPHTFFSRPIVASASGKIDILCNSKACLTGDGQTCTTLEQGDLVFISAAESKARIIQFGENDYFERIKNKLYKNC